MSWRPIRLMTPTMAGLVVLALLFQATPSLGASTYEGSWSGTTSQGKPFSFTVDGDAITYLEVQFRLSSCTVTVTFTNSTPITGNTFSISAGNTSVDGTFQNPSTASGSARFVSPNPACSGTSNITWTAGGPATTPTSTVTTTPTTSSAATPTATLTVTPTTPGFITPNSAYMPLVAKPVVPTPIPTVVPTVIPTATTAPQPGTPVTWYMCYDDQRVTKTFLSAQPCTWDNVQLFVYANTELSTRNFEFPLTGDIAGRSYTFTVQLASRGTTTFNVSAIVRQNGSETTLASTSFTANSSTFQPFTTTVAGPDPATQQGDTLVLRIQSVSGSDAAILIASSRQTFLRLQ